MKFNTKKLKASAVLCMMLTLSLIENSNAQINQALKSANGLHVCDPCNQSFSMGHLNADMIEHDKFPGGTNYNQPLRALTWGNAFGMNGLTPKNNMAYFWWNDVPSGNSGYEELPHINSPLNPPAGGGAKIPAYDPDIALFNRFTVSGTSEYGAMVVYEAGGDIYIEPYLFDLVGGNANNQIVYSYTWPPPPPPIYTHGQWLISQGNGNARNPHIDVIVDNSILGAADFEYNRYVVSWEEYNPNTGKYEVWNAEGDVLNFPTYFNYVGNGVSADVAGVSNTAILRSPTTHDDDMIYTSYIQDGTNNIVVSERKWGDPNVTTTTLYSGGLSDNPRIAAPAQYDFSFGPANNEPVAVVVAEVDNATPVTHWEVNAYCLYDPANTPSTNSTAISDYMGINTFSNNSTTSNTHDAIRPVITGAGAVATGAVASAGGTPYEEYPIMFYSDLTFDDFTNTVVVGGNGNFYASNVNDNGTAPPIPGFEPVGPFSTGDFNSVYVDTLVVPFDQITTPPSLAVAVSKNSGYDLLAAYWDGQFIRYDFTGSGFYSFKPGKETSVAEINQEGYNIYPNPVNNMLNINNAAGVSYTLLDMTGKVITVGQFPAAQSRLNVSGIPAGTYLLQLSKDNHAEKVKFVKQ